MYILYMQSTKANLNIAFVDIERSVATKVKLVVTYSAN